jgi:hypothetical protein
MRYGTPWAAAAVALTVLAVLATAGGAALLLYLVQFGLPALLLPWLLNRGVAWDRTVVTTLGLVLVLGGVVLSGYAAASGQSALAFLDAQISREIDQTVTLMGDFAGTEQSADEAAAYREMVASMAAFMHRAYPGMLVVVGAALQLLTVGLLILLVRPRALPGPVFAEWRAPELMIWPLIAAGFGVFLATGAAQTVALNLLVVLLPPYFLQGLAVVECFLGRRGWSPLLRGCTYLLLLVINPLPVIVTSVGVFDLWADFRKPRLNKE